MQSITPELNGFVTSARIQQNKSRILVTPWVN